MKRTDQLLFIGLLCVSFTSAVLAQVDSIQRRIVDVPNVDPGAITIDGQMNEPAWANAAHADLVTQSGFDIWAFDYYRTSLTEPDYDAWYARMLWAKDTLYLFVHIDEVVNDSTNLYWNGKFTGDQLFVSLSSRLGVAMEGNYDGNPYAAPDGPFHFWVLGNKVTLNDSQATNIPPRYRRFPADTVRVFDAHDIARWATTIDTATGVWNVEMAIYSPNVNAQSCLGFNLGGSTGSRQTDSVYHDAYGYYTWQPNVPNQPFTAPNVSHNNDPGYYNLVNSDYWKVLHFDTALVTSVRDERLVSSRVPRGFSLSQNYPNPFNPSTKIRYALPHQASVKLVVFNVLGQQVSTLAEGQRTAGVYEVVWDASELSSGLYFYTLKADGNLVETKKMLLMK